MRELDIPAKFEVNVIEIRRKMSAKNQFFKTINQEIAGPETMIEEDDILYVNGPFERASEFAETYGLVMLDQRVPSIENVRRSRSTPRVTSALPR